MTRTVAGTVAAAADERRDAPGQQAPPTHISAGRRYVPQRLTILIVVIGLALTGVLTGLSRVNYLHNEHRLVRLEARLTASALAVAPVDVQRRLGRAVSLMSATGDVSLFRQTISPSVRTPFEDVLLYHVAGGAPRLMLSLGGKTLLVPGSHRASTFLARAEQRAGLHLTRLVAPGKQRLGYAVSATGSRGTYVVYAEQVLPADHRITLPPDSPLADVYFAFYLGSTNKQSALIETNAAHVPLGGTTATTSFQFGDMPVTLVVAPRGSLAGTFAQIVAWLVAVVGALFTLAMAVVAERLVRRRAVAEELAAVNRHLYHSQRSVAETLQHSLLPRRLPVRQDLDLAVRYLPGTEGIEVGGDWYDVVNVDDTNVFFTIGDVSGRGLDAAILMATLRNAINAYVVDGDEPGLVLAKISRLVDIGSDGRFATVVCGRIDLSSGIAVIANAGHPSPLLLDGARREFVHTPVGPPIGVGDTYSVAEVRMSRGATLIAYTDGLVERRGEAIDAGFERLRAAARPNASLDAMLDDLLADLVPGGADDDIAVLGVRWHG